MSKIKIVTDSSAQLTSEEIKKHNITVIPLTIEINDKIYVDGETITRQELVEELKKGNKPKTSRPPIGRFIDAFNRLGADGSQVIAIMITDVLSGTYETAVAAARMSKADVTVINSKMTDRGLSFQVLKAAEDAETGKSVEEIKKDCKDIYSRTRCDVLIDNLGNLLSGGRLAKWANMLTKLINLKIIVRLRENSLDIVKKGRSSKIFYKYLKETQKYHENNQIVELSLSNVDSSKEYLEKIKEAVLPVNSKDAIYIARLTSPIIMTHTGLNAVGVITLTEKKESYKNI